MTPQPAEEPEAPLTPAMDTSPVNPPKMEEEIKEQLQEEVKEEEHPVEEPAVTEEEEKSEEEKENAATVAPLTDETKSTSPMPEEQQQQQQPPQQWRKRQSQATALTPLQRRVVVPKGVFDVPLDLPPSPPAPPGGDGATVAAGVGATKAVKTRVYVCPICGDNALSSLRERDKHLQAEHTGELVFPCQVCGCPFSSLL